MRCLLALLVLFALYVSRPAQTAGASLSYREDEEFIRWCAEFYNSEDESDLARIYPTWRENADYVQKQNSLGSSYTLSLNKFAHLTPEQLLKQRFYAHAEDSLQAQADIGVSDIPKYVNWTSKGVVPPVSDQDQCGTCVVFSVIHSVDSFHAIKTGHLVLGSVEEYIDCCLDGSCVGELYDVLSYTCIVKIGGLASVDEYKSPDYKCLNNTYPPVIKIDGGKFLHPTGNETVVAMQVAMQPVVAAIDASHLSFQMYKSGIYDEPDCSSTELDHTVLVVGYGSMDGKDYWICQNSWGVDWGMEGYILMSRNKDNQCGIATDVSYPY